MWCSDNVHHDEAVGLGDADEEGAGCRDESAGDGVLIRSVISPATTASMKMMATKNA